jgi:hypothetical protein
MTRGVPRSSWGLRGGAVVVVGVAGRVCVCGGRAIP